MADNLVNKQEISLPDFQGTENLQEVNINQELSDDMLQQRSGFADLLNIQMQS